MKQRQQVVLGTGALGLAVMRALHARGEAVTLVNRSGRAAVPSGTLVVKGNVTDPEDARRVCRAADVVYHCVGAPYGVWAKALPPVMRGVIEGAAAAGAKLVYGDNLYMYGPVTGPLREDLAHRATGSNGRVRAKLADMVMDAHKQGRVRATIGRASDFYGPHARNSKAGDGIFLRALEGKPAQVLGDPDTLHSYTFVDDFAAALLTLGERDEALGKAWHVPNAAPLTTRAFVQHVHDALETPMRLSVAPKSAIRLMGVFNPTMRAVAEVLYQSEKPWLVDHSKFEHAFGAHPTPHHEAIQRTLAWYREAVYPATTVRLAS